MNVYQRLNAARAEFHQLKLKKSGHNKFAGYNYFELGDFLIPAMQVFTKHGLCAMVSFSPDLATMTIVNTDKPEQTITITSPLSSAALKGCHEVQNLGAVETYQRRYLWVAALEIVEHDALDATTGAAEPTKAVRHSPVEPVGIAPDRMAIVADSAEVIGQRMAKEDTVGAYEVAASINDPEEKQALWKLLDSKTRSAIKKHAESLKEAA